MRDPENVVNIKLGRTLCQYAMETLRQGFQDCLVRGGNILGTWDEGSQTCLGILKSNGHPGVLCSIRFIHTRDDTICTPK